MSLRRFVRRGHIALGLAAGAWLALIGLSGTILVFGHELDAWLRPELLRVRPAERQVSWGDVLAAAVEEAGGEPVTRIRLPQRSDEAAELWLAAGSAGRIYVDPFSGRVLGTTGSAGSLVGIVRRLHTELLGGRPGRLIVGAGGLCLACLALTGLGLWWPRGQRWRRVFRLPRSAAAAVRLHWLHRSAGGVAALPLVLSGLTGTALVFNTAARLGVTFVTGLPAPPALPRPPGAGPTLAFAAVDEAIQIAAAAVPDAAATWVWLPTAADPVVTVRLRTPGEWHPNGRNFVALDAASLAVREVIDVRRSRDASLVTNAFYPLHIGGVGGLATRLAWLLVGLAPGLLFGTAAASIWLRRRRPLARRPNRPPCSGGISASGTLEP